MNTFMKMGVGRHMVLNPLASHQRESNVRVSCRKNCGEGGEPIGKIESEA